MGGVIHLFPCTVLYFSNACRLGGGVGAHSPACISTVVYGQHVRLAGHETVDTRAGSHA